MGAGNPERAALWAGWLGRDPELIMDTLDRSRQDWLSSPFWFLDRWKAFPGRLVLAVRLIPETGGRLADGARGEYTSTSRVLPGIS